jgi:hypothetical protein
MAVRSAVVLRGAVLVFAAPPGTLQDNLRRRWSGPDRQNEQVPDLRQRQGDQLSTGAVAPLFAAARARVAVRKAWVSIAKVMWRYHPVYWRTWY